jgi:Mrp family chromosome partitioning ATPase
MSMMTPTRRSGAAGSQTPEAKGISTFRNLYTRVLLGLDGQEEKVVGVTSAIAGEGKSTIASGLAAMLADDGALLGFGREPETILLIECNMGTPPQDSRLAMRPGPGLVQLLLGECALEAAVQPTGVERLSILPAGEPTRNFPPAIRTAALPDLMTELRGRYGLIVLDMPAVLNSTDTQLLAQLADRLILVVRAGVTPAKLVGQALEQLGEEKWLGVVLNDSESDLPSWLEHRL